MRAKPEVVKFTCPGLKPDVRLKVFDTHEYHVHSIILKIHSGFFRAFFDSPDKIVPASNDFAYEWVTKIDEDGSWHLIAAQHAEKSQINQECDDGLDIQVAQQEAFANILCAMYLRPYVVTAEQILMMTELADYYCALRVVSRTLDSPMRNTDGKIGKGIQNCPLEYLKAAVKLRNSLLFRNCLMYLSLGPWDTPPCFKWYKGSEFYKYRKLSSALRGRVSTLTLWVHSHMLATINDQPSWGTQKTAMQECILSVAKVGSSGSGRVNLPAYYRALHEARGSDGKPLFGDMLWGDLMSNKLELFPEASAGEGQFEEYFLCGELDDEDLPWDIDEDDW